MSGYHIIRDRAGLRHLNNTVVNLNTLNMRPRRNRKSTIRARFNNKSRHANSISKQYL